MSNMFGTPHEHEESVKVRTAQRNGTFQSVDDAPATEEGKTEEPVVPEVEKPMVVTPDGKMVEPESFDLFSQERQRLAQEEERLMNLRDTIVAGANIQESNEGDQGEPEENALTIPRIELPEDDTYVDDTQRSVINGFNAMAEALENSAKTSQENIAQLTEQIGEVGQEAHRMSLEQQLNAVEAHYGVDRRDLFAASRATNIQDPETLARIVLGEQAQQQRLDEARTQAETERTRDAGGIGGNTRGSANAGGGNQREEVDYNDNEALARVYKIGQPTEIV